MNLLFLLAPEDGSQSIVTIVTQKEANLWE